MNEHRRSTESSILTRHPVIALWSLWSLFALVKLSIHLISWHGYGIFRDELYFIDCGRHLDFGYVDHAPMVGWIAALSGFLFGDSLFGLRLFPALAGAAKMVLVGWMARELGGGRYAQGLACLAFLIAPVFMASDSMLDIVCFEQLLWMVCTCVLVRIIKTDNSGDWLWFGLAAGLGLLTKHSFVFLGFATVCALLLTPGRKYLLDRWMWIGGLIAACLALPNLIWQIVHGWPTLSFLRMLNQYSQINPLEFCLGQVLYHQPILLPVWLLGLYHLLGTKDGRQYRLFGWIYIITFALFLGLKGKVYYVSPAYPILFAAGCVWIERFIQQRVWGWLRPAIVAAVLLAGVGLAPIFLPILPIGMYRPYVAVFTRALPTLHEMEQLFVDRFGWENQAATIAKVYHSLPPEEREICMILAANYGEAGAINLYGKHHGLPEAVSGYLTHHLWGPRGRSNEVAIVYGTGVEPEIVEQFWEELTVVAHIQHKDCSPWENNLPVFLCRKPKMTVDEMWPLLRRGF